MSDELSTPTSYGGKYKRRQNDNLEAISGKKFCTSCMTLKPVEKVKIYKSMKSKVGVPRCDECQAKRKAYLESRK